MGDSDEQATLFELSAGEVPPAPPAAEHVALGARLPGVVRLGTMSWSYPGWTGLVYGKKVPPKQLSSLGLTAYAKHPLLRAVEIDRTYYEPPSAGQLRALSQQTPDDFRFLVKAHEDCVVRCFPTHARYGQKRGERNARYLDAAYAADSVVAPLAEGLGEKAIALLFQFPPQDVGEPPPAFAERIRRFVERLPAGVTYAIELRNAELFTPAYAEALLATGAVHCHNVWPGMPPVLAQARAIAPPARRPLVVRWLLREGDAYDRALARSEPFDRLVHEDPENRDALARLVARAAHHDVPSVVLVDNKAEGCAPESIARLARAIAMLG